MWVLLIFIANIQQGIMKSLPVQDWDCTDDGEKVEYKMERLRERRVDCDEIQNVAVIVGQHENLEWSWIRISKIILGAVHKWSHADLDHFDPFSTSSQFFITKTLVTKLLTI